MSRFILALLYLAATATTSFAANFMSSATLARNASTNQYDSFTPQWNSLRHQVNSSSLSQAAKNNANNLISSAGGVTVPDWSRYRNLSGTNCNMDIYMDPMPDYIVSPGYYEGSAWAMAVYLTVNDVQQQFTLTVNVSGSGSASGAGSYNAGTYANINASASAGWAFSDWDGDHSGTSTSGSVYMDRDKAVTAKFEVIPPAEQPNRTPTISWSSAPSTVQSGQTFTISAVGADQDGNLATVSIDKNGSPFAYAGGGNGQSASSGNSLSETGPQTITFTAWATDGSGARSGTISHTVTVLAANRAPSISWTSNPGTVASGASFTISASGYDPDGNLATVSIDRDGSPFAYAGGGNGTSGSSGNGHSATGPASITFTAWATDSSGARSSTISHTVNVTAANNAPSISWSSAPASAVSGQQYTISATGSDSNGNLQSVTIRKNGGNFTSAGGGNGYSSTASSSATDTGAQIITYTAFAQDSSGATSSTISHTVSVTVPSNPPSVSWTSQPGTVSSASSYTVGASAADSDGNLATLTITKNGSPFTSTGGGNGFSTSTSNSSSDSGPQTITYVATATDANGASASISQNVTVNAPGNAPIANIYASPSNGSSPLTTNISWSTANVSSATISGPGLSSSALSGSQLVTLTTGSYVYTINATGPNGSTSQSTTVTVNPRTFVLTVNSGAGGSASGGGTYNEGSTATVSSTPNAGYVASGFTGDATGPGSSITVLMDSAKTVTAIFSQATYSLTTAVSPAGAGSASGGGTFTYGQVASISASPAANYLFSHWSTSGSSVASSGSASTTVSMTAHTTATAVFVPNGPTTYNLTVNTFGDGTTSPSGTTSYNAGEVATVMATPGANATFNGWTGDVTSSASTINVVMNGPRSVTASFTSKAAQTISFPNPGDKVASTASYPISATASSGLPVTLTVVSGPATLGGSPGAYTLNVSAAGVVTIQATQAGNAAYLPATPVSQTFNGVSPMLRIRQHGDGIKVLTGDERDNPTIIIRDRAR